MFPGMKRWSMMIFDLLGMSRGNMAVNEGVRGGLAVEAASLEGGQVYSRRTI